MDRSGGDGPPQSRGSVLSRMSAHFKKRRRGAAEGVLGVPCREVKKDYIWLETGLCIISVLDVSVLVCLWMKCIIFASVL